MKEKYPKAIIQLGRVLYLLDCITHLPVCFTEPMEDLREVVQKRGQRVHHTKILYSPWYGQYQSSTTPGLLEMTKNIKMDWNLQNVMSE